jgi:D-aminopeptidase
LKREDFLAAIREAKGGPVAEGAVGAGTGTQAFGFKGGIGTSSRLVTAEQGGYTVGVLVQSNFGGILVVDGVPVGEELASEGGRAKAEPEEDLDLADGSIMMVVATDAPLLDRNLRRLATRALVGMGRTGSSMSNGSGDYVIAFANHAGVRRTMGGEPAGAGVARAELGNNEMSGLFEAAIEATEEAIYNSMFRATTVTSRAGTIDALPLDRVRELLARYRAVER